MVSYFGNFIFAAKSANLTYTPYLKCFTVTTPGRRQSKTPILSGNVYHKIVRNGVFDCISKTLFLSIFDPRSSIVDSVFDCRLPGVATFFYVFYVLYDFYVFL